MIEDVDLSDKMNFGISYAIKIYELATGKDYYEEFKKNGDYPEVLLEIATYVWQACYEQNKLFLDLLKEQNPEAFTKPINHKAAICSKCADLDCPHQDTRTVCWEFEPREKKEVSD